VALICGSNLWLYASIWIALVLLVAAEIGKGPLALDGRPARWAHAAWLTGGVLAIVHALLALAIRYHWDHALAVRETASQGAALYGFAWSGSIYVNYVFLAVWIALAWRWRNWFWRLFVLVMVVNGAILFARPGTRPFGALLVALLLWAWTTPTKVKGAFCLLPFAFCLLPFAFCL
jgi:hypothetical protein